MTPGLDPVLDALRAHLPIDAREASSRRMALRVLPVLERPFDRDASPTHVTGSGIVVGADGVLLLRHKRLGIWVQPGGHLEAGEMPWDAARRESEEETGLRLRLDLPAGDGASGRPPPLLHVDVHAGGGGHIHVDLRYRLAVTGDEQPSPPPGESPEVAWFGWDEAQRIAEPALRGLLGHLDPRPTPRRLA